MADLISQYKFGGWTVTENIIRYQNGSEIIFKGVHNNTQSIKSTEGIDICFVEEAQSISQESIDVLIPTVRKEGSFFVWCWNPLTEQDPVWTTIASKPDERTYIRKVNSEDIEELLSPEIIHEREKMKVDNPDMYAHVWLGQPLTSKTGTVFGKQIAQAEIEGRIGSVPYDASAGTYTAIDLGIGDSTAIWWFQIVGQEIHFIDHYESSGEELGHYISVIKNKPYNYTTHFLPHDAKQRELQTGMTRVEFFENNGIHNIEVLRPTNFHLGQDDINMIARPKFSKI
jgi:phage terminase large subunit